MLDRVTEIDDVHTAKLFFQLAFSLQLDDFTVAAHQDAIDEHHRKRRESGPKLDSKALLPLGKIAAIFKVRVGDAFLIKQLTSSSVLAC